MGGGGDRPEAACQFTAEDLLAITMLGVRIEGYQALEVLYYRACELNDLLTQIPPGVALQDPQAVARFNLGIADWFRGRLAEAERVFVPSIAWWADRPTITVWGRHILGQVQRARGRLDTATLACRQALERTALPGRPTLPAAGPAYVGLAEVAYQRSELDDALRYVTEGIALCRQLAYTPPLAAGLVTLAWIRQAAGDRAGALQAMGEAGQAAPGPSGLLNPVPAQQARLLLAQGNLPAAAGFVQQHGLGADEEPDYPREPGQLVLARVLLAQDRPGQALALLDRLHGAAEAQDRTGSVIEIGALRALARGRWSSPSGGGTRWARADSRACAPRSSMPGRCSPSPAIPISKRGCGGSGGTWTSRSTSPGGASC